MLSHVSVINAALLAQSLYGSQEYGEYVSDLYQGAYAECEMLASAAERGAHLLNHERSLTYDEADTIASAILDHARNNERLDSGYPTSRIWQVVQDSIELDF